MFSVYLNYEYPSRSVIDLDLFLFPLDLVTRLLVVTFKNEYFNLLLSVCVL